jgi:leucyl-tRNA synthetase
MVTVGWTWQAVSFWSTAECALLLATCIARSSCRDRRHAVSRISSKSVIAELYLIAQMVCFRAGRSRWVYVYVTDTFRNNNKAGVKERIPSSLDHFQVSTTSFTTSEHSIEHVPIIIKDFGAIASESGANFVVPSNVALGYHKVDCE